MSGAPRPGSRRLLDHLVDPGTWVSWDQTPVEPRQSQEYAAELAAVRKRTGLDESITTGTGKLHGRRVAFVVGDFEFLAGSIGVAAAERIVSAVERATHERLALVAAPTSGGTRMQEGTVAFLQMVKISAAVSQHRSAGLPYVVYLRHPTTGGVLASWGSLGHVTAAEPGALIGFVGPRVYEVLHGKPFPPGVQVSENLVDHGLVDAVVGPDDLREFLSRVLDVLQGPAVAPASGHPDMSHDQEVVPDTSAWSSVLASRRADRPSVCTLLASAANTVTPLRGLDNRTGVDGALLALARFGSVPCVVVGHTQASFGPAGLRTVRRGMQLARQLDRPLVSVIDTAGAELSKEAEQNGLAREIARCISELVMLPAPTVCVLLGQGAGGGALALLSADRVLCAQNGWLSPLPPEGVSAILFRDTLHAPEAAEAQGIGAAALLRAGIVDTVMTETSDMALGADQFMTRLGRLLERELSLLARQDRRQRVAARLERYRLIGLPTSGAEQPRAAEIALAESDRADI